MKYIIYSFAKNCDCGDAYVFTGTEKEMMERVRAMALDTLNDYLCEGISWGWDRYAYPAYKAIVHTEDSNIVIEAIESKYIKKIKTNRSLLYKAKKMPENGYIAINNEEE